MEILLAMSILIVGLTGILSLFPSGLNATKKAIEDTNSGIIAESTYASLRAAAEETVSGGKLYFFYDGIDKTKNSFPGDVNFKDGSLRGKMFGIPGPQNIQDIGDYTPEWCSIGQTLEGTTPVPEYNVAVSNDDKEQMKQYSFNIQISYPSTNTKSLYDVVIRIRRNSKLIKKYYSQVMIPTAE